MFNYSSREDAIQTQTARLNCPPDSPARLNWQTQTSHDRASSVFILASRSSGGAGDNNNSEWRSAPSSDPTVRLPSPSPSKRLLPPPPPRSVRIFGRQGRVVARRVKKIELRIPQDSNFGEWGGENGTVTGEASQRLVQQRREWAPRLRFELRLREVRRASPIPDWVCWATFSSTCSAQCSTTQQQGGRHVRFVYAKDGHRFVQEESDEKFNASPSTSTGAC
ncbi:hypothetical protein GPALN_003189 [Globodera pallida]|nr:hypothetical protein GPALN_003189 [Globodera pallida]